MLSFQECAERARVSVSTIKREVRDGRLLSIDGQVSRASWDDYVARARLERLPTRERRNFIATLKWPPNPAHDELLNRVAENKQPLPYYGPAVYFLYKGDEVVYVGKAVKALRRVGEHVGSKDFDAVSWIACKAEELDELERRAILRFKPPLNKI